MTTDEAERRALEELIWDECDALDVTAESVPELSANLYELERTLIPHGLHVLGEAPAGAERAELVEALMEAGESSAEAIEAALDSCDELGALIHALDGGYVRPAPGGDLLANPEVLPTGRNLHGFDPFRLPTRFACEQGKLQANRLLARHAANGEAAPESLAMVLWGTDNMKSEGAQIAQVLSLMGARPRMDSYGRLAGAELIPLEELGRPRIDVVVTLSGIFRDLLPLQTSPSR